MLHKRNHFSNGATVGCRREGTSTANIPHTLQLTGLPGSYFRPIAINSNTLQLNTFKFPAPTTYFYCVSDPTYHTTQTDRQTYVRTQTYTTTHIHHTHTHTHTHTHMHMHPHTPLGPCSSSWLEYRCYCT